MVSTAREIAENALHRLSGGYSGAVRNTDEVAIALKALSPLVARLETEVLLISQTMIDEAHIMKSAYESVLGEDDGSFWGFGTMGGLDITLPDVSRPLRVVDAQGRQIISAAGESVSASVPGLEDLVLNTDEIEQPLTELLAYDLRTTFQQTAQDHSILRGSQYEARGFLRERMNRVMRQPPVTLSGFDQMRRARLRGAVMAKANELRNAQKEALANE